MGPRTQAQCPSRPTPRLTLDVSSSGTQTTPDAGSPDSCLQGAGPGRPGLGPSALGKGPGWAGAVLMVGGGLALTKGPQNPKGWKFGRRLARKSLTFAPAKSTVACSTRGPPDP